MGETRHTASSLKMFRPKQPNGVSRFLSSVGCACNVTLLWLVSSFFLWFSFFCSDHSPTATSAPSLRPAHLEQFPDNLQSVRFIIFIQGCLTHFISHTVGAITHGEAGATIYPVLTQCTTFSFVLGSGRPLHKVNSFIFRNPLGVPTTFCEEPSEDLT
jgi:hypothetical protein